MINVEEVLALAKQGFHVFPCIPHGKTPLTQRGFHDATTDEERIRQWWSLHPEANVGIATGEKSGIWVLDVDVKHGGADSLWKLQTEYGFDYVPTVHTPSGGFHFYFQYVPNLKNKVGILPGIDIRTEGGYVISPPSDKYRSGSAPIRGFKTPDFIFDLIKKKSKPEPIERTESNVLEGGRNHYIAKVAGYFTAKGMSYEAVEAACLAENEAICNPPLNDDEVIRTVKSIFRNNPSSPFEIEQPESIVVTAQELLQPMIDYVTDKDLVKGESTGVLALDKLLGGGKRLGEVTAWHAEAKTGKNTIWHFLMYMWLQRGIPIGYASRELTPETEVLPNLLSLHFEENYWLANLNKKMIEESNTVLTKWPLYFARGYGFFSLENIKTWIDELIQRGVQYFWFDHLHYMLEDPEDHKEASKLIKDIKSLAKEKNIHIDIIIQPNKLMEGQRLSLNSMKGGAAMGQAIDNLIVIERLAQHESTERNISRIAMKAIRSKLGSLGSFYLRYHPDTTAFSETTETEIQQPQTFANQRQSLVSN